LSRGPQGRRGTSSSTTARPDRDSGLAVGFAFLGRMPGGLEAVADFVDGDAWEA